MRRHTLCALFALACALRCGEAQYGSARDLTVRLFFTAPVQNAVIEPTRPGSATMRLCASCVPAAVNKPLHVRAVADEKYVLVEEQNTAEIDLDGQARITTSDGRNATAAGHWKIRADRVGLHVTLEVPSERYVMAVLQSEAGVNDGPEALKALAVVARSFALAHPNRHGAEGLCDSTHCQALHMMAASDRIRDAVLQTAGETLWSGGIRVDGYFTQNCGGRSADASEVWGGPRKPWLISHPDPYCQQQPAHWQARVTSDELAHALRVEGFESPSLLREVRIIAKDSSGRATKLALLGDGKQIVVSASSLRFAVNRELGWNRMRSDWYGVHVDSGVAVFDGRGYGHGVGMCQAGAAEMARAGKRYREILAFYFPGTHLQVEKNDEGWRTTEANGWTLHATQADGALVNAANSAWAEAKKRWADAVPAHPTITVAPDTELFRQLTNEPGWVLASTSGSQVTLQPLAVVSAHSGPETLLLHEFLHVLVESEASASAPLWLREGLVEVMTHERAGTKTLTAEQIEKSLRSAQNLREAQQAHEAAGLLVQKVIAKYGLGSVRGWLRSGVPASVLAS